MKVYVITSGEYSDYHIDAVALDENEAKAKCAFLNALVKNGDYCYIEEYDTEDFKCSTNGKTNLLFKLSTRKNADWENFSGGTPIAEQESIETEYAGSEYIICRAILPDGTSEDKAKKIMRDHIAKFKAEQEGI